MADSKIEVSVNDFLDTLTAAMVEARKDERRKCASQVEQMIHEDLPGAYIVLLRKVRDELLLDGWCGND